MPGVPERAIQNVKVLPEFDLVEIALSDADEIAGWLDPLKVERVLAVRVDFEICVSDNGPGILDDICEFRRPGLTVVQKIITARSRWRRATNAELHFNSFF